MDAKSSHPTCPLIRWCSIKERVGVGGNVSAWAETYRRVGVGA